MPTRNVFLSEHFDRYIASGIEAGRYSNASEVVRDGLRLLEQRDAEDRAKVEWLRGAAQERIALSTVAKGRVSVPWTRWPSTFANLAALRQPQGAAASIVAKSSAVKARLSPEAEADLQEILAWSERHFVEGAAMRYAKLVTT